ncbi:unnamed protein product [Paramecium sonneborni]|uniref:PPPDE domain-containing protein n=1 Tax=Paramecium sonneborni TaxID=65129 RepID=A0A8S1Q442_9CILI|nr:unnamed protein product [Paramecium sonneborni]
MDNQKHKVILNMYDLSQGMAKQFSPMFLGKQIEAIWHTGIVVYGKEYYFGGGICAQPPKSTIYGYPIEERELGETDKPQHEFESFLRDISFNYTMEKYDLFTNNCNNFTNECALYLVGKGIPENIIGLPKEFLNTQLGQMLKPIIVQITNRQSEAQTENFNEPQPQQQPSQSFQNMNSQQVNQMQPQPQQPVLLNLKVQPSHQSQQHQQIAISNQQQQITNTNVASIEDWDMFFCLIESSPQCIINFYTDSEDCKTIKQQFHKLSLNLCNINFYDVNCQKARIIADSLQINEFPTFIFYEYGQVKERWTSNNQNTLIDNIQQQLK